MNLPDKIIDAIEHLPFADRGQVYAATISFMLHDTMPEPDSLSETARGTFMLVVDVLRPILRRRRRDAARRAARRAARLATEAAGTAAETVSEMSPAPEIPVPAVEPSGQPMEDITVFASDMPRAFDVSSVPLPENVRRPNRAERRRLERLARRKSLLRTNI